MPVVTEWPQLRERENAFGFRALDRGEFPNTIKTRNVEAPGKKPTAIVGFQMIVIPLVVSDHPGESATERPLDMTPVDHCARM